MNNAKIQAAAKIISDSAIEHLANKHGLTQAEVMAALLSGNQRAIDQFMQLIMTGIDATKDMHDQGVISLA